MDSIRGVFAQKFKLVLNQVSKTGQIGTLDERGFCSMDTDTLNLLKTGQGEPDTTFVVDAGLLGNFQYARKQSLTWKPRGVENGVVIAEYTLVYMIDGTDFQNVMNS
jgi:hypothetical protein